MEIQIELTRESIPEKITPPAAGAQGAWLEFRGVVRHEENGARISALEYEAYPEMAVGEIRRLLVDIAARHPCLVAKIIHRTGVIPVGETAIYAGVAASHRAEALALLAEFMDRLKQDVPIWKRRALPAEDEKVVTLKRQEKQAAPPGGAISLDEALGEISLKCRELPPVQASLEESVGRTLRETVCAPGDLPDRDRSTRDGYAVLQNDTSDAFRIVDTLHAADWKPRELKAGEAVRVATGASLPCGGLRVVMQEDVARDGEKIRIVKADGETNIRKRGEEAHAGAPLVRAGTMLNPGKLALLASAGCVRPMVSPRLRIVHFTTGDEVIPPDQMPAPGQIRDSNSILIRGLLQKYPCVCLHVHLREDFEAAKAQINGRRSEMDEANLVLISGGASVGDKDFTRPLLEWLGFEVVFSRIAIRPGKPTIFGINGSQIAFGIPGNPLAHFVCFHLFVAAALAKLCGGGMKPFLRGRLARTLDEAANARETLWPVQWTLKDGRAELCPLEWSSSGDITCLAAANGLVRIPANTGDLAAGVSLDFLPTAED